MLSTAACWAEQTAPSNTVLLTIQRITIPELDFKSASIREVVDALNQAALTHDPDKKGVTILLLPSAESASTNKSIVYPPPTVTFSARNISLHNALKIITQVTGLKCRIKDSVVRIMTHDEPEGELIIRMYSVYPTFIERTTAISSINSTNDGDSSQSDLMKTFANLGVQWPRGSSISYNPGIGKVIVCNTADNHHFFETALNEIVLTPRQVETTAEFVRLDATNFTHASSNRPASDVVLKLIASGIGQLLAAPVVISGSGDESIIKSITAIPYPTRFEATKGSNSSVTAEATAKAIIPSLFETREVGLTMSVLPEIAPSGDAIALTYKWSYLEQPIWKDFGHEMPVGTNTTAHIPMEQPAFHSNSGEARLTVTDGQPVLVFGGLPTQNSKGFIYCILTLRVIGNDGLPLKRDNQPYALESIPL